MQAVIQHIFEQLGGPTAIATGTGFPVQTVHSWLGTGENETSEIPPWRRQAVLDFARREKLPDGRSKADALSNEARAYLTSTERTVRKAAA